MILNCEYSVKLDDRSQKHIKESISWCVENCAGDFKQSWANDYEFLFELQDDAIMFKLSML